MYCLFCSVLCIVCVYMCTVLLPPGDNPIAVNKYIISVACPALQYFSTFSHKRHDFRKRISYWTQKVCFEFLYNFCLKHFSFQEELSEIWPNMYIGLLHVKCRLLLADFNETWIFSADFRKIFKYQISWKSVRWGEPSYSMRTDGQVQRCC